MNILAIDTSNEMMGIAILKNETIIGEVTTNIKKGHSMRLMPAINALMDAVDVVPDELDKIIIAKGPGSFTGVRIGITTAKTLAWALNIPIVGVSSIEVMACQGRFFNLSISPFFDARRERIFTGLYRWENNKLAILRQETNISLNTWLDQLVVQGEEVLFLSPDILLYKNIIIEKLGNLAIIPEGPYHLSKPSHMGLLGVDKEAENTHLLTPNYLRLAEAESNWLQKQKEVKGND